MAVARRRRSGPQPAHGRADRARDRRWSASSSASPRTSRSRTGSASTRCSSPPTRCALNSPVRIAGVNVGKVKSVKAQGGHQPGARDAGDQGQRAADPRGRDGQDPPAHLPRGQLLRRPAAGHAVVAEARDGDTIKVTRTATPVQLDEVLTALQSDTRQDLRDLLDGARAGPQLQAERGRRPRRRPVGARRDRRRVLQRRLQGLAGGAARRRPGQRGAARHRARARRRAAARGHREDDRRADPQRGPAQGPDHELQHHDGRVRRASRAT